MEGNSRFLHFLPRLRHLSGQLFGKTHRHHLLQQLLLHGGWNRRSQRGNIWKGPPVGVVEPRKPRWCCKCGIFVWFLISRSFPLTLSLYRALFHYGMMVQYRLAKHIGISEYQLNPKCHLSPREFRVPANTSNKTSISCEGSKVKLEKVRRYATHLSLSQNPWHQKMNEHDLQKGISLSSRSTFKFPVTFHGLNIISYVKLRHGHCRGSRTATDLRIWKTPLSFETGWRLSQTSYCILWRSHAPLTNDARGWTWIGVNGFPDFASSLAALWVSCVACGSFLHASSICPFKIN